MFRPSPRLGPQPTAPDSSPDRHAAHYERRLLLAQALGDTGGLKDVWEEYWQFLSAWQATEKLQAAIPGTIPIATPVVCTPDREREIRRGLEDARPLAGESNRHPVLFAFAWYTIGEYDLALAEIETLSLDGELSLEIELLWGLCLARLQHWEQALDWFQHAAGLDPKNPAAHAGVGFALRSMGRPREALVKYRLAGQLDPGSAEVHFLTGDALNCLEQYGRAHQAFSRAVRLAPENGNYREHHERALECNGITTRRKGKRGYRFGFGTRGKPKVDVNVVPSITGALSRAFSGRKSRRKKRKPSGGQADQPGQRKSLRRRLSFWGLGSLILAAAYFATPHDPPAGGYGMTDEHTTTLAELTGPSGE